MQHKWGRVLYLKWLKPCWQNVLLYSSYLTGTHKWATWIYVCWCWLLSEQNSVPSRICTKGCEHPRELLAQWTTFHWIMSPRLASHERTLLITKGYPEAITVLTRIHYQTSVILYCIQLTDVDVLPIFIILLLSIFCGIQDQQWWISYSKEVTTVFPRSSALKA